MVRRDFLKVSAALTASTALRSAAQDDGLDHRNERPDRMQYRKLGRTNFLCSRLVFGCGAALIGGRAVRLLDQAYEAGINFYDNGSNDYYKGAEKNFAAFLKAHKGDIWVTSKGYARSAVERKPGEPMTTEYAKSAAQFWLGLVDGSLADLETDYIDAYYTQGTNDPALVKSEEMGRAFETVKQAGKVGHIGLSTHQNQEAVLEAALETGWYDIAMIAVTPAGWYDWIGRRIAEDTPTLRELRPILDKCRAAGMGLIGMKIARHLSLNQGQLDQFDRYYEAKLMQAGLNPFQRSYAYVLENGLDAVNADMQNLRHFEENWTAVRRAPELLA